MRKTIVSLFLILLLSQAAFALEQAEPLDFIFKGGDYTETSMLIMENSYSGVITGPDNIPITFTINGKCEFRNTSNDEVTGVDTYTAAKTRASAKSEKPSLPSEGYTLGLLYKRETSELSWYINDINGRSQKKIWTQDLTEDEYPLINFQSTITAQTGGNALLVQYSGIIEDTGDIVFDITNANAPDKFTKEVIKAEAIPGYFQITQGGVLHIDKIVIDGNVPVLYYEWTKEPRIQVRDHVY